MTATTDVCAACNAPLRVLRERRAVSLGQRRVVISDEWTSCDKCEEEFYTREQATRRHVRAIAKARSDDGLLPPVRIRAIRESLGLTQRQFEELLGVGEKTCVRWESGRVCQNTATDRLIRLLAADRENIRHLAAINGVMMPDSAFVHGPRSPLAAHNLASTPLFPDFAPIVRTVTGTQEPSLSETDEHAVLDAAHLEVPLLAVDHNTVLFHQLMSGGRTGHHRSEHE